MSNTRAAVLAPLVQVAAALTLLTACFQLFANWFDATIAFLGDTATVEPLHVRSYHQWLAVGGVSLGAFAVAAWVRRRRLVAPVLLGVLLAASAMFFHVASPGASAPDPAPASGNPHPCYSGSNDCPGG